MLFFVFFSLILIFSIKIFATSLKEIDKDLRQYYSNSLYKPFRSDIIDITGNNIKATARPNFKTSNYFFLSINDFQQNSSSNFVSSSSNLVVPSTTLARISLSGADDSIVVFSGEANNTSPERKYFGPCDIQRLEVNLMDKFGRLVDTGGTDYSFAITFK